MRSGSCDSAVDSSLAAVEHLSHPGHETDAMIERHQFLNCGQLARSFNRQRMEGTLSTERNHGIAKTMSFAQQDERQMVQIIHPYCSFLGQRMVGRHHKQQFFLQDRFYSQYFPSTGRAAITASTLLQGASSAEARLFPPGQSPVLVDVAFGRS